MKYLSWILIASCLALVSSLLVDLFRDEDLMSSQIQDRIDARLLLHRQLLQDQGTFIVPQSVGPADVMLLAYDQGKLIQWNTQAFIPPYQEINREDDSFVLSYQGARYLVSRSQKDSHSTFAITVLSRTFETENEFLLPYYNQKIFPVPVTFSGKQFGVNQRGKLLFSYDFEGYRRTSELTGALLWNNAIQLSIWVLFFLRTKVSGNRALLGLAGISLGLNAAVYFLPGAAPFDQLPILFHVFIVGLTLWLIAHNQKDNLILLIGFLKRRASFLGPLMILLVGCLLSYGTYLSLGYFSDILGSSLDITQNLRFTRERVILSMITIYLGFALVWVIHYFFRYASQFRITYLSWAFFTFLLSIGAWFSGLEDLIYVVISYLALFWLTLTFSWSRTFKVISYQTFFYIITLIAFVSTLNAIGVYKQFEKGEIAIKNNFAQSILDSEDLRTEENLEAISKRIQNDPNIRSRFLSPNLDKSIIRKRLNRQYLTSSFDKYEKDVFFYDQAGFNVENRNKPILDELLPDLEAFKTNKDNIYFLENWENLGRSKYILLVPIYVLDNFLGHILIDLTLKKVIPRTVYPALLHSEETESENYDYVLFRRGELTYSKGNYSFDIFENPDQWQVLVSAESGVEMEGFHLLARSTQNDLVIVISELYSLWAMLSNFSFQFLIFLTVFGIYFMLIRGTRRSDQLSLANRIQLYLGLSFILPLILVSGVILNLLNNSYRDEINRNYQKRANTVAENIYSHLRDYESNTINRDDLYDVVGETSSYVQTDLNIYAKDGQLLVSSQPDIYANALVSTRINALALEALEQKPEQSFVVDEQIGSLGFKTVYQSVLDHANGDLLGIISIPFFNSKNHLNRQQLEVFGNLLILFTLTFVLSVVFGYFVLRNITHPITTLSKRLSETNLEAKNEPLDFQGGDEIGKLVSEYNKMVLKLEASKEALAQSQKETAWKEIARQVAHEIKNPLTPMRLKIQQLMRQIPESEGNNTTLKSLITQIDTLSEIADSFSAFAKMPAPNNKALDFSALVTEVSEFYQSENAELLTEIMPNLRVFADPNILKRMLNNLILNGIQASANEALIEIQLSQHGDKVILKVKDHGEGVPEDVKHKIFTPYFSTKEKGSGIGLAIAKKGIEQAGGSIWFDANDGPGTTFTVLLPIHRPH